MSYDIQPFNPKTSRAREGMRLAKVGYKTSKKSNEPKKESKCVSVPGFQFEKIDASSMAQFIPHFESYLESVQDGIIRDRVEEGAILITDSDIGVQKILEYLEADARGDRLTVDMVKAWFDSELMESLTVALADQFGIGDEPSEAEGKRLEHALNVYRDKFATMAGGRTQFPENIAKRLRGTLEYANDCQITERFKARLDKMMKVEEDIFAAL